MAPDCVTDGPIDIRVFAHNPVVRMDGGVIHEILGTGAGLDDAGDEDWPA